MRRTPPSAARSTPPTARSMPPPGASRRSTPDSWALPQPLPVAAALLCAFLLLVAALSAGSPVPARAATIAPETREVASATAGDFRVTFTATMRPDDGSGMPLAAMEVAGYARRSGRWMPLGSRPVPGPWFWNVVTDTGGVCDLTIGTRPRTRASITLNNGSSLGCGRTAAFHVEGRRLVSG